VAALVVQDDVEMPAKLLNHISPNPKVRAERIDEDQRFASSYYIGHFIMDVSVAAQERFHRVVLTYRTLKLMVL
jgi:hypothetical protein